MLIRKASISYNPDRRSVYGKPSKMGLHLGAYSLHPTVGMTGGNQFNRPIRRLKTAS